METYDLICSFGSNCSTTFQIKKRGLRFCALPFDWIWWDSDKALNALIEGFKNNFDNFMNKENFRELEGDEYSQAHNDRFQFEDTKTGVFYYNHFYKVKNKEKEINSKISLFKKRCKRLQDLLIASDKVLIIISAKNDLNTDIIKELYLTIQQLYPNTKIYFHVLLFSCKNNEHINFNNLNIYKYTRDKIYMIIYKQILNGNF